MFEGWDELFVERVVARGLCDRETADRVWRAFEEHRRRGEAIQIGQVFVRERLLAPGDLVSVLREMGSLAFRCVRCDASYEIRRYQGGKEYLCRKCGGSLLVRGLEPSRSPVATNVDPPVSAAAAVPEQLGFYRLERELGHGGMGTVYRGRHAVLGRLAAIKVVSRTEVHADLLERFRREAMAIARIDHPNIVRFLEWGEQDGFVFYAMDLVEGVSLDVRLATGPLAQVDALRVVEGIARAVHAAHEIDVLHRDLKPSNVMIRSDGVPVLLDFGLARILSCEVESLTGTGVVLGTPHYMSPEQATAARDRIDRRSDVYSLGVILYECLTGARPYEGTSFVSILRAIRETSPRPLRERVPGIDPRVEAICLGAMAREPEGRPATAGALADALRAERERLEAAHR